MWQNGLVPLCWLLTEPEKMRDTHLRPDHIGEPLVAALLERLQADDRLGCVWCLNTASGSTCQLGALLDQCGIGSGFGIQINRRLRPLCVGECRYRFDPMSQVDCVLAGTHKALAIEIKLGTECMSASAFTRKFLSPCGYSNHVPPGIRGRMTAALDGRFEQAAFVDAPLHVELLDGASAELLPSWGLIVRRKVWQQWKKSRPAFHRACWLVQFEDLASAIGGPELFDEIVLRLVRHNFAESWLIDR